MSTLLLRTPRWVSHRRLLEQKLADPKLCSDADHLKQLHCQLLRYDLHRDPFVAPKLVSSYSLRRLPSLAAAVFRQVQEPNALLYNTLIRAYAENSQFLNAFGVFVQMLQNGVFPDNFTYPFLLKACSGKGALFQVQMIHAQIAKCGFWGDVFVPNSLIVSYSKVGNGSVGCARRLFDEMPVRNVVSWNSIIVGLARDGELREARRLFDLMPERDAASWNLMVDAHAKAGEMDEAFELFGRMPERNVVSWSSIVGGYCKCGDLEMARMLFDKMPVKNLVSWTIMVTGYAEKGLAKEASCLFDQMEQTGLEPDAGTAISILAACAGSGLLALGERVHASVERTKLRLNPQVCNAAVVMYAKCGQLAEASRVFDEMAEKDTVSWNAMIQGLAMHGHGERALELFARMKREGFTPDGVTFIGFLCACTHFGLVEEGRRYFASMETEFGIVPQIEHFGCMVDLLGRGGLLKEAFDLIESMPFEPNAIIWGTLLGACRMHNNIGLAEEAVNQLIKLEPSDAGNYAILSNTYAAVGRWDGVARARIQMKGTGEQKPAGSSWIEINDEVCKFTVGDRTHPQSDSIFRMLGWLLLHLKQVGYVPEVYS